MDVAAHASSTQNLGPRGDPVILAKCICSTDQSVRAAVAFAMPVGSRSKSNKNAGPSRKDTIQIATLRSVLQGHRLDKAALLCKAGNELEKLQRQVHTVRRSLREGRPLNQVQLLHIDRLNACRFLVRRRSWKWKRQPSSARRHRVNRLRVHQVHTAGRVTPCMTWSWTSRRLREN